MNPATFFQALKSEAKRSPKKAAVLGLALLAAGYYWAPLVTKWFGGSSEPSVAGETAEAAPIAPPAVGTTAAPIAAAAPAPAAFEWREFSRRFESGRRTRPARLSASKRSLFGAPQFAETQVVNDEVVARKSETTSESLAASEAPPADVSMTLEGVILLGSKSAAVINGRAYRIGEMIQSSDGAAAGASSYRLVAVKRGAAVVSREGERREILVSASGLAAGDRIEVQ
jgi:hypothetical protein